MNKQQIAAIIDHAILKPDTTLEDLKAGCAIAAQFHTASVCVRPCDVENAVGLLSGTGVKVGTVIGFPHGANETDIKLAEAELAMHRGAVELDMVQNIGRLRSGDSVYVENEIAVLAAVAHRRGALLKVILETCYLTDEQIVSACCLCERAGADYVKTSTGFGSAGAKVEVVALMRESVSAKVGVKASGGIRTMDDAVRMVQAGAGRLGTGSTKTILESK